MINHEIPLPFKFILVYKWFDLSLFNITMKDNLVEQQIVKMNKKSELSPGKTSLISNSKNLSRYR